MICDRNRLVELKLYFFLLLSLWCFNVVCKERKVKWLFWNFGLFLFMILYIRLMYLLVRRTYVCIVRSIVQICESETDLFLLQGIIHRRESHAGANLYRYISERWAIFINKHNDDNIFLSRFNRTGHRLNSSELQNIWHRSKTES